MNSTAYLKRYNPGQRAPIVYALFATILFAFALPKEATISAVLKSFLAILCIAFYIKKTQTGPSFVNLLLVLGFGVQGALLALFPWAWTSSELSQFDVAAFEMNSALDVTIVGMASFIIGSMIVPVLKPPQRITQFKFPISVLTLSIIGSLAVLTQALGDSGGLAVSLAKVAGSVAAVALLCSGYNAKSNSIRTGNLLLALGLSGMIGASELFSKGQRGTVLFAIMPVVWTSYILEQRLRKTIVAVGAFGAIAFLFVLPAINTLRQSGTVKVDTEDISREMQGERFRMARLTEGITWVVQRASYQRTLGIIVSSTPEPIPYYEGQTYMDLPLWFVPRAVLPGKIEMNAAARFATDYFGWNGLQYERTSAIAPSVQGEAYANFGWWGVIPICLILGWAASVLSRIIYRSVREHTWVFCWTIAFGVGLLSWEQALDQLLIITKLPFYALFPIYWALDKKKIPSTL
jgi:hypothetical protein